MCLILSMSLGDATVWWTLCFLFVFYTTITFDTLSSNLCLVIIVFLAPFSPPPPDNDSDRCVPLWVITWLTSILCVGICQHLILSLVQFWDFNSWCPLTTARILMEDIKNSFVGHCIKREEGVFPGNPEKNILFLGQNGPKKSHDWDLKKYYFVCFPKCSMSKS